jgi:deoxyribodipyrimidine photo-lyase
MDAPATYSPAALRDADSNAFTPTRDAALARIDAIDPRTYARTRNHLRGAVTRLSPYITHGLVSVPEAIERVHARHPLSWNDKLAFEFAWREYFHHAWQKLGPKIWEPAHPPPAPASAYRREIPADILEACTGVAIIDQQIRVLYEQGYLHNHARMWIASYLVHLRKVDWRDGAAWMYAHLLDGDLASNTLSWQWVAGTWTGKPYLFNAENVMRYSGVDCAGTAIDRTYEALDDCARSQKDFAEPARVRDKATPTSRPEIGGVEIATALLAGHVDTSPIAHEKETCWLMHPWSLNLPEGNSRRTMGILVREFHTAFPWSPQRYAFVLDAMRQQCETILVGTAAEIVEQLAQTFRGRTLHAVETMNPHYAAVLQACNATITPAPRAFDNPAQLKRSFSSYWNVISRKEFPV